MTQNSQLKTTATKKQGTPQSRQALFSLYIVCPVHFSITSYKLQNRIKDLCEKWILMMDSYLRKSIMKEKK